MRIFSLFEKKTIFSLNRVCIIGWQMEHVQLNSKAQTVFK